MDFFTAVDAARVTDDLIRCVRARPPNHAPFELEFRLGTVRKEGRFDPSINETVYKNILAGLKSNPGWARVEESHTIDYYLKHDRPAHDSGGGARPAHDGARLTHNVEKDAWTITKKTKIANYTLPSSKTLDVRVSLAEESDGDAPRSPDLRNAILVRDKRRTSFSHKFWRYDITEVVTKTDLSRQSDEDRKTMYEIELELTDPMQIEHKGRDYVMYIVSYGLALCCDMMKLARV